MHVHDTKSCYTKIVQVEHAMHSQSVVSGSGRGESYVIDGYPQIYKVVKELLKLDIVYRVDCGEGYIMVTVSAPHRWKEVIGLVQYTIAKYIND